MVFKGYEIMVLKCEGDLVVIKVYQDYVSCLVWVLVMFVNFFDLDVFVLGGGMLNIDEFYDDLFDVMLFYVFLDIYDMLICKVKYGDSFGVCGVVWFWN